MHPAYSVIFFTCASGAGYGLLIWLALWSMAGAAEAIPLFFSVSLTLAVVLIVAGLASSTLHLGRPERAWRALSQWRTSWLSREGVMAIATFVPIGLLGLQWMFDFDLSSTGAVGRSLDLLAPILAVACALVTVWCTGMIYASLPTIRAWSNPLVTPLYVVLALATGGALAGLLLSAFGLPPQIAALVTLPVLIVGWMMKGAYWSNVDSGKSNQTLRTATGLGGPGVAVRTLDPPHTQANYVMREMGYSVGRRHAEKLRRVTMVALFLVPSLIMLLLMWLGPGLLDLPLTTLAVISTGVGVLTERWLFFAEARHVAMQYYGADGA